VTDQLPIGRIKLINLHYFDDISERRNEHTLLLVPGNFSRAEM
jgi:hypothetical protein